MIDRPRPPTSTLGELRDFDRAFDRAFVMVTFVLNRHLVDHMLRVGRDLTLDDYAAMLVWGVLAHQNIAHLLPPGALPSVVLDDRGRLDGAPEGLRPMRLRDLVQITRLPRETVRRKLERLAAQQWVERTPRGWVSSRARLEPTLREFNRESVRRFLTAADEVMRILRATDADLAAQVEPTARGRERELPRSVDRPPRAAPARPERPSPPSRKRRGPGA
jgi:hypothetical protein